VVHDDEFAPLLATRAEPRIRAWTDADPCLRPAVGLDEPDRPGPTRTLDALARRHADGPTPTRPPRSGGRSS